MKKNKLNLVKSMPNSIIVPRKTFEHLKRLMNLSNDARQLVELTRQKYTLEVAHFQAVQSEVLKGMKDIGFGEEGSYNFDSEESSISFAKLEQNAPTKVD